MDASAFFSIQHRVENGTMSILLQYKLQEETGRHAFIDAHHSVNLNALFTVVAEQVKTWSYIGAAHAQYAMVRWQGYNCVREVLALPNMYLPQRPDEECFKLRRKGRRGRCKTHVRRADTLTSYGCP